MERDNPPEVENEMMLWHGTTYGNTRHIKAMGFNRSFSGKNGMMRSPLSFVLIRSMVTSFFYSSTFQFIFFQDWLMEKAATLPSTRSLRTVTRLSMLTDVDACTSAKFLQACTRKVSGKCWFLLREIHKTWQFVSTQPRTAWNSRLLTSFTKTVKPTLLTLLSTGSQRTWSWPIGRSRRHDKYAFIHLDKCPVISYFCRHTCSINKD